MQKKILFLGGSKFQIPPIKYAKEQGHYVITCDYLPENPGHKYADEYHNVSTTDKEAILELAKKLNIDGIVAYASDPAAPTQAYVGNKLGLPSNPYKSVEILARKDLFRDFLEKHNFLVPKSKSFYKLKDGKDWIEELTFPIIVKPVDSSGSKGVTKVENKDDLSKAFEYALTFSREKKIVLEEFFVRDGYQVAGDGFVVDGKLAFRCWANEHFDKLCNPLVPIGESFPSIMNNYTLEQCHMETQRLLDLLGIKIGALNFDFHYNKNGDFSFLELGPRNGGNLIPEVIKYSTNVDLIKYTVDSALGLDCSDLEMKETKSFYSSYMLHSLTDGIIKDIWYSDKIKSNIIEKMIDVKIGDIVYKFNGSNHTLGTMIMKFKTQEEMLEKMDNMEKYLKVIVE
ncbi:ATP-grasp domain-containing protein [Poseidonibacter lekithochrous]|uniref:ATP-grasp domain-containing protein n=1 Tax=Poseidonibacter TaxID=2321187 RepID=UPI001C0A2DFB|nr:MULTISPECIES: ATP-grasp domain-containing protein [Poseidonibacter]MBU3014057.1 ATP-grasp domain-containing protein [Poseidonibacter lekithochrous]MDO6827353.1 ATP-grasp domain-containing protein [Poseidonibacter sp. 1_MG-2023]